MRSACGGIVAALAITQLLASGSFAADQAYANVFVGNIPKCTALSSGRVVNSLSDDFLQQPASMIFCDEVDLLKRQSPLVGLLKAHQPVDRIDGMYFAVGDVAFTRALCGVASDTLHHLRLLGGGEEGADWVSRLKTCLTQKLPKANIVVQATGQIPGISSFHPKFLLMSNDNDTLADILISSGNPTRRAPNNLDDYLLISIPKQDRIFLWHLCLSEIFNVKTIRQDFVSLGDAYQLCSLAHLPSSEEETLPYLMPFDREPFLSQFAFWAGKSDKIDIVSQGYNSLELANILRTAAESGTKISIIRDDDLLMSNNPPIEGELLNSIEEYYAWDRHICGPNVSTRFLVTNSSVNYLHSKFVVFSGAFGRRVLFGSANLTHAALHSNIENVYFSRNQELARHFQEYFNTLWSDYALTASETYVVLEKIGSFISTRKVNFDECDNYASKLNK
ncbi:hypothetical protein JFU47_12300 [Pseudomonas sp. TH39(2020)]|uniref:phospholipase D-like domain-containing protein n=1 Tax=Pseudomonas sp. TH39(2020) TaxID=2796349 RepID=UPI0019130CD5|nr:phospholipase D-like domain-containing protein [Pseudomonas sp. TH39(2020)]MBK5397478.1 hypothetical protein [Pseudomonas sp. TH39(2020)]